MMSGSSTPPPPLPPDAPLLRTRIRGARQVCVRLDAYSPSVMSRQGLAPGSPQSSRSPEDNTPRSGQQTPKEDPSLDNHLPIPQIPDTHLHTHLCISMHTHQHICNTPPPAHARHICTMYLHTRTTHLHTPAHICPAPPRRNVKMAHRRLQPAAAAGRMRSQDEDAEAGCFSRRFAAGAERGRGRAPDRGCGCRGDAGWGRGALCLLPLHPSHANPVGAEPSPPTPSLSPP